jgi:hypothetical protein
MRIRRKPSGGFSTGSSALQTEGQAEPRRIGITSQEAEEILTEGQRYGSVTVRNPYV